MQCFKDAQQTVTTKDVFSDLTQALWQNLIVYVQLYTQQKKELYVFKTTYKVAFLFAYGPTQQISNKPGKK